MGKRFGPERLWFGAASAAGPAAHEGENIYKTIYISPVCVGVKAVLRGEVGATDRGWYNKIRFGTYNIRNGRDGGLESALHRMSQANMDLGVFQETNLTKRIDTHKSSGYQVVATEAPSAHSGGVAMLYRAVYHCSVEALQTYRANVISFHLAAGNMQWFIVGCYLAPDEASKIEDVIVAISHRPQGDVLK